MWYGKVLRMELEIGRIILSVTATAMYGQGPSLEIVRSQIIPNRKEQDLKILSNGGLHLSTDTDTDTLPGLHGTFRPGQ